jgi:WD40 repeat protein
MWDLRVGEKGGEVKQLSVNGPVVSMELSLDGKHLTAVSGKTVHFFDRNSYLPPSSIACVRCVRGVRCVSADAWLGARWEVVKTHTSSCELASASLRGAGDDCPTPVFVTGGTDFWVHLWDFETDKELGTPSAARTAARTPHASHAPHARLADVCACEQACTRVTTVRCTA